MPTPPACVTDPHPTAALQRMSAEDRATYRAAACRATRLYPGPIGELVYRELLTFVEFGWRLPSDSLLTRLRDDILRQR